MSGTDKEPVGSVSVCGPASGGQSSILDESVQETVCENALDYARDVYKFSFNPPLASIQESRDEALTGISDAPRAAAREYIKQRIRDELQAIFKDALKEAHEEAVPKALAAFEFATRAVAIGCAKQEYKRHLEEFMRNEYEGFEDSVCKMALKRASEVYKSALKYPQSHTNTSIVKEPIGSVLVRRSASIASNQSVQENCQIALDHAKDVYKSSFKPPLTMLTEAGNKAMAAFKAVAVGAGGPGSIRRQYKKILRDIMCKEYEDAVRKTHEEAVANALLAFESAVGGAVGSVKEKYKRPLEDFMRNQYEGYQEAEIRRMLQVLNYTHLLPSVLESLRSAKMQ